MDSEEHMEETRRLLLAKVSKRMAEVYGLCEKPANETEQFDRVLALWIDMQRAILEVRTHQERPEGCTPWACPDPRVAKAWSTLTESRNLHSLENLFCQLPEGPQRVLARKAVKMCFSEARKTSPQHYPAEPKALRKQEDKSTYP